VQPVGVTTVACPMRFSVDKRYTRLAFILSERNVLCYGCVFGRSAVFCKKEDRDCTQLLVET